MVGILALALTQAIQGRTLPPATTELPQEFTRISSIRELADGRVLVVDGGEAVVRLADFDLLLVTQVGRPGAGPGEYRQPRLLLRLSGDSTLLTDTGLSRSIIIGPRGVLGGVLFSGIAPSRVPRMARAPKGADHYGRVYFEGSPIREGTVLVALDSAPLLRYDPKKDHTDTLTEIKLPTEQLLVLQRDGARRVAVRPVSYIAQDLWTALPDGRVAVVRTGDYHLEIIGADGRISSGPRIPYSPIPIDEVERIRMRPTDLPDFKPPFEGPSFGGPTLFVTADFHFWIRSSTAAGDSIARYDVLEPSGRLEARVSLPPHTRVVGFGKAFAYLVRKNQDDVEFLGRLPLPRLLP